MDQTAQFEEVTTDVVQHRNGTLVEKFAGRFSVEPNKLLNTLKQTAFRQSDGSEVSNEQMMGLLVVADQYGLNPFTKEIYAFPDKKNGIVPIVGLDGWSRIINQHTQFDGMEFRASENIVEIEGAKAAPEWMECVIYRKDREHPTVVREYLDEVYRPPFRNYSGPWQTHTKRFLRHKAMIQCARLAFGFVGIYDQDEGERIIEADVVRVADNAPQTSATADLNANLKRSSTEKKPDANNAGPQWTVPTLMEAIANAMTTDQVDELADQVRDTAMDEDDRAQVDKAFADRYAEISAAEEAQQ